MHENVTISHRGARYEIGRAPGFYGIWPAGELQSERFEWWPETPEGWQGAWSRFTGLEAPGTIVAVGQRPAPVVRTSMRVLIVAVIALGVGCGIAGLFPGYLAGASLAQNAAELVPHAIYLAAWAASAVLVLLGGARLRAGALLAAGTSVVTFGLFFADIGQVIAGGARLMDAGLVLSLIGWLGCAAGSAMACWLGRAGAPGRPRGHEAALTLTLAALAAIGAAVAFAPSWDSYTLRTAAGAAQSLTAGNAFANPAPVIAGDIAVMVALAAVVIIAGLWRPVRLGAALLAGAVIPMAAQAISALVQVGQGASPLLFGISPARAAQAGLTISSGLTPVFWVYCVFVVALLLTCTLMLITPALPAAPTALPAPRSAMPDAAPPATSTFS